MDDIYGVGCMTGTSVDGIDVCIVKFAGGLLENHALSVVYFEEREYPEKLRRRVREAMETGSTSLVCQLNFEVALAIGDAINATVSNWGNLGGNEVSFVASHGQTIYHIPQKNANRGWDTLSTLQVGDGNVIQQKTGIPLCVTDFRPADMACGGQGAPLVPFFDKWAWGSLDQTVALVNIGGIANCTILPLGVGFDCGPGNCIIDVLCQRLFNEPYDRDGELSAQGVVDPLAFQDRIWPLGADYFDLPPPKSTGRELFNNAFVSRFQEALGSCATTTPHSMVRMAVELTARSIWHSVRTYQPHVIIVTGGGSQNPTLLSALTALCPCVPLEKWSGNLPGLTSRNKEAVAFAVLGLHTLRGLPSNVPTVTGAALPCVLGKISMARGAAAALL